MNPSILQQVQEDIAARLEANEDFQFVPVTIVHPLDQNEAVLIQTRIDEQLSGRVAKNGKAGLACLVMIPEMDVSEPDLPGPQFNARCSVRIIEDPTINRGANGVQVTPEELAMTVLGLLHHWGPFPSSRFFAEEQGALVAVEIKNRIAWECTLVLPLDVTPLPKVATPVIAVDALPEVSFSGPAGSTIYYTTDGSLPSAANGSDVDPLELSSGTTRVRAVAVQSGFTDSDIAEQIITV